jgi:hypothetical protein
MLKVQVPAGMLRPPASWVVPKSRSSVSGQLDVLATKPLPVGSTVFISLLAPKDVGSWKK